MRFTIISHVLHKKNASGQIGGYAPYVREMNLWLKYVDELIVVAPIELKEFDAIDIPYNHQNITFLEVPLFNLTSSKSILRTVFQLPQILSKVYSGLKKADHIHLRCPGNMGLIGSFVQILFPKKQKTAKYAGNWDFESKQPWSYRVQQRVLRNTFLTKNMQVLVYGEWPDRNQNIKPFFTATYHESEIENTPTRDISNTLKLIYIGTLSSGKQPVTSAKVAKSLIDKNIDTELHFYGEGPERESLENYISSNSLDKSITLHGNVDKTELIEALKNSHFLVFISKSEGWPKAVAESMFWGCVPLTTKVSCVPNMVGNGERGDIVNPVPSEIAERIIYYKNNPQSYTTKSQKGMNWSRQFTLERFESEIMLLLN